MKEISQEVCCSGALSKRTSIWGQPTQLTAIVAHGGFKAYVSRSCCPKMPRDWVEGKCVPFLPATNVFACNMSKACDREDGVTCARHPALGGTLCSASAGVPGSGALQPTGRYLLPWTSTSSPTLTPSSMHCYLGLMVAITVYLVPILNKTKSRQEIVLFGWEG